MPENRVVLKNCEAVDPWDVASYMAQDGLKALEKAKRKLGSDKTIEEIKLSGLRGRGGAGFPCGAKWELASQTEGYEKYFICNADEGEVGTFKDRYILEHDPFSLLEGIAIGAHAIGANKVFIYLRGEYRFIREKLWNAIQQFEKKGGFQDLKVELREGAGSYICGEESALMNSIEGIRGEARYRPPFPPVSGLHGKPTIINNVETLVNIPRIILNGAKWFSSIGTEKSKGTKVFSVSGDVQRPGVYEMTMGCTLNELLDIAGTENVKLVQVGGATGRIVPNSKLNALLCYEGLLGSGAVTVLDESRDVIEFVYQILSFLNEESCGKCTPCREGTQAMVEVFERLHQGEGRLGDIEVLEDLSEVMRLASLCGLGQAASLPVIDTLEYFRNDYDVRITQSIFFNTLRLG